MDDKPEKIRVCFLEEWAPIDNDKVEKGMYEISNARRIQKKQRKQLKKYIIKGEI